MFDIAYMARGLCTFRQADVTKAVKAVRNAGCGIGRVEIDKQGKITVHVATPQSTDDSAKKCNDLDQWIASRAR